MIAVYIIIAVVLAFLLLELLLFLIAFAGHTWMDFTKHDFRLKPELRKYGELILSGVKYCRNTPHTVEHITSRDGLRLSAKFYDASPRRGIVIMAHGYRSVAENDFSCSSEYMHDLGFAILLIDQRGHGKSQGRAMTFGIKERWDVIDWVKFVTERFPEEKIILEGLSMGAATVVMAAGEKLPENVVGVIADCGYTSPREIICHVIRSRHLPVKLLYPLVKLSARIYGGFDLEECSAEEAARRAELPALFIHGEADDFVPCYMGRRNFEAWAGEKRIVTVAGAGHGLSYVVDMERCKSALNEFISTIF